RRHTSLQGDWSSDVCSSDLSVAAPDSARNQDLGMVEHRLFLTADAPRRIQGLARHAVLFPEVTVILGDPRLPDPVKRDGRFNEEIGRASCRERVESGGGGST